MNNIKLNHEKSLSVFSYGLDCDFGSGIILNGVSFCVSLFGYFIGISW